MSRGLNVWHLAKFSSEDSAAVLVNNLHSSSSTSFSVVASVFFPHDDEFPPLEARRLIEYCNERRLPLVLGCDANAQYLI